MSMMNAAVTAENRPDSMACQEFRFDEKEETHKNESGIQILVVFLLEIFVVLSDFLFELVVKTGPEVRATIFRQH